MAKTTRICPYSQAPCTLDCSKTGEHCFQMRNDCETRIRQQHKQFGNVAHFEQDPPTKESRDQGDLDYYARNTETKRHPKLQSVYFQGIDKRRLNPAAEKNKESAKNAKELRLRNALRYKNTPKPSPL